MSSCERKGKKRTKSFYKKSAYGGKRPRGGQNILEPGIRGFLIMCNSNENIAVKECYNILNEYADKAYGLEKIAGQFKSSQNGSSDDSDCEDAEVAMKKEINSIKVSSTERRFQNVMTKAKNCVFIRSTVEDPIKLTLTIMEEIAQHGLRKARYAARILPIIGTCKAHTHDIEKLAKDVLLPVFSQENSSAPSSYTILFKVRNNNASTCGRTSVVPVVTKVVSEINPSVNFSWSDFEVAVLVEVVCTVCCLGVAPGYIRLRKYNLQELVQGPKIAEKNENSANEKPRSVKTDSTANAGLEKGEKFANEIIIDALLESSDPVNISKLSDASTAEKLQQSDIIVIAPGENSAVCHTHTWTDTSSNETKMIHTNTSSAGTSDISVNSLCEQSYVFEHNSVETDTSGSVSAAIVRGACEDSCVLKQTFIETNTSDTISAVNVQDEVCENSCVLKPTSVETDNSDTVSATKAQDKV